ncbi:MAG: diaminopimelate epimerase [Gemmatimonadaceae bacterium]
MDGLAAPLVGGDGTRIEMKNSQRFWKMTGSGNDFVFFDAMHSPPESLATPAVIGALCDRRNGIGADGVVFLEPEPGLDFGMKYYNRDGSLAEMCGNAALCSARLATDLGIVSKGRPFAFQTPSGPVNARFVDGLPEIDMVPIKELTSAFSTALESGERAIGYARVGVPHVIVLCEDVERVDVTRRGRVLRLLPQLAAGANANFISGSDNSGAWLMRTYERGVEAETLACGTGAVAAVALLSAWGLVPNEASLRTRSGRILSVRVPVDGSHAAPVLRGEGRVVFEGKLADFQPQL